MTDMPDFTDLVSQMEAASNAIYRACVSEVRGKLSLVVPLSVYEQYKSGNIDQNTKRFIDSLGVDLYFELPHVHE